jgi:hypothetical protein
MLMKHYILILLFIVSANGLRAQLFIYTQFVNPACHGQSDGFAFVTVNGGTAPYTFSWSNGAVNSNDTLANLAAGKYYVTVTDAGSNTVVDSLTLTDPPQMGVTYTTDDDTICDGIGSAVHITATEINGGPYTFNYILNGDTSPNQFSGDFYLSQPGNYTFTAISNFGCTDSFQLTFVACAGYTDMAYLENLATNIKLFPNPGTDIFNIASSLPIEHLNIYTPDGTLVHSIANPTNKIDTGLLPSGFYLAEIRMGTMHYRIKWVKL